MLFNKAAFRRATQGYKISPKQANFLSIGLF